MKIMLEADNGYSLGPYDDSDQDGLYAGTVFLIQQLGARVVQTAIVIES